MTQRLLFVLLACAATAWACSVPVFRYALEHWHPDKFEAVVTHRGTLSEAEQAQVRALQESNANLSLRTVESDTAAGTRVGIFFPRGRGEMWSGPLAEAAAVLDSPARQEIAKRLGQGESAVWVLLESGDEKADAAAAETIEKRLEYLSGTLELPKLEAQDIANGLVSVGQEDLRLEFSTLRLKRSDPKEGVFIKMLLGTEQGLDELTEPIVFPVFGRGRALYALVGGGIKPETIDRAAMFLIGKCSCEVKDQNPGADLLMTADWTAMVKAKAPAAPDLPTLAELTEAAPVTVTISADSDSPPAVAPRPEGFGRGKALVAGAAALLLLLAAGVLMRRK